MSVPLAYKQLATHPSGTVMVEYVCVASRATLCNKVHRQLHQVKSQKKNVLPWRMRIALWLYIYLIWGPGTWDYTDSIAPHNSQGNPLVEASCRLWWRSARTPAPQGTSEWWSHMFRSSPARLVGTRAFQPSCDICSVSRFPPLKWRIQSCLRYRQCA